MNAILSGALRPGYLHLHIGHRKDQLPDSETKQLKDNLGDHKQHYLATKILQVVEQHTQKIL